MYFCLMKKKILYHAMKTENLNLRRVQSRHIAQPVVRFVILYTADT